MKKFYVAFAAGLMTITACTDTAETVSREYRCALNEGVDAMMFVTDNGSAKRMQVRVFKHLSNRFKGINQRMQNFKSNRKKKEFVKEVFESEGVNLYLTELKINRERYGLEITRLRDLFAKTMENEKRRRVAAGDENPINPTELCKDLHALVDLNIGVGDLKAELDQPRLIEMMNEFKSWDVKGYKEMFDAFDAKRKTVYETREFQLVTARQIFTKKKEPEQP